MSDSATLLFLLGMAGFVLGILFLYIAIFRSGWIWGLVCLLLPPLLLLLIPLRWRQTQYGLYTLLAGLLVAGAALYGGADAPVQTWLERPQVETYLAKLGWHGEIRLPFKPYKPGPLPNAAQAEAVRTQEADERRAAAEAAIAKQRAEKSVRVTPSVFQPASLDALGKFVGSTVRVTGTDGGQITGELKRVNGVGVAVAVTAGGGGVTYHLAWTRVSSVEVYAPKGSVAPPSKTSSGNAVAASGTLAAPTSSAPAASVTLAPAPKVTPLPPAATQTSTTPVVPPAAASQAAPTSSTPAASATVASVPKVAPLPPAATQTSTTPVAPPAAASQAVPTSPSPAATVRVAPVPKVTPTAPAATQAPLTAASQAAPTSSAPAASVTLKPVPKVVPLPPAATQTSTMPIAPPAAAAQAPSSAVDGATGNMQ